MTFWSGEKLARQLPGLIAPFDPNNIDCASYALSLGEEVFVTSDQRLDDSPDKGLRMSLAPAQECRIPPGQFAFLATEEIVQVPTNALGLISMRARYKFKGLVNVSGFHVDPGWNGKLVFGIYNAGPAPVVLSRGTKLFLIWYADLDSGSEYVKKVAGNNPAISDEMVSAMAGQVFSPIALNKDVQELKEKSVEIREEMSERSFGLRVELAELRAEQSFYKKILFGAVAVVISVVARELWLAWGGTPKPVAITISEQRSNSSSSARQPDAASPSLSADKPEVREKASAPIESKKLPQPSNEVEKRALESPPHTK